MSQLVANPLPPSPAPPGARRLSLAARRRREGWLLAAPALIVMLVLSIVPFISAIALSFQQWDLQNPAHPFVGLQNFQAALQDARVWGSLGNTGLIVLGAVAVEFLLGLGLALLLVGELRGKRLILPLLMLPVMMVPIVVALTWKMLWDNQYGAVNQLLALITRQEVNIVWLAHRETALTAMVITDVWQWTPFMFLILLAGLTGVNPELYEAASLDGAGWWQALRDITLPSLAPVIAVAILFRGLEAFKIFDFVYMFTQGGPGTSTESVSWYIYQLGLKFFRMGYAAAVSILILILLTVLATLYVNRFMRDAEVAR